MNEARTAVLLSNRLLFRKTFAKILLVLDSQMLITEIDSVTPLLTSLPKADSGLVLTDIDPQSEEGIEDVVLSILGVEPEAAVVIVLHEQDDTQAAAAMNAGALCVMIKAAPPQVLIDMLQRALNRERFRPSPVVTIKREEIPGEIRSQLSARQQKLLRLMIGGHSISTTAAQLGMTPSKVVKEMRVVLSMVRGFKF